MKTRTWMLGLLAAVPLAAWSQQNSPPGPRPTPATANPASLALASASANSDSNPPRFDLHDPATQRIVRNVATHASEPPGAAMPQSASKGARELEVRADVLAHSPAAAQFGILPVKSRTLPLHFDCLLLDCIAYDAAGNELYTIPREQYYGADENRADAWLSCQSGNDMLSTFERFKGCRGVSLGIPTGWQPLTVPISLFSRD